jgi:predicted transposase YbfD/YdcC
VPDLLRALELAGCIVTLDALHCQKTTAREIHEADADYVLALKGNQGTAHQEIRASLDDAILRGAPELVQYESVEKGHGRIETRRYWQSADLGWFADRAEWENLRSIGVVEAVRELPGGAPSTERRYYLSSLPPDIARFARAGRGHWSVENQLHWSLDVTFDEDRSRARPRHAATNLAILRRIALNLLRADKSSAKSLPRKRLRSALDPNYLTSLLSV